MARTMFGSVHAALRIAGKTLKTGSRQTRSARPRSIAASSVLNVDYRVAPSRCVRSILDCEVGVAAIGTAEAAKAIFIVQLDGSKS